MIIKIIYMTVACWLRQANSAVLFSDKGRARHFALKGALVRWPRAVACQQLLGQLAALVSLLAESEAAKSSTTVMMLL